ncbi:hypothetical protein DXG01_007281, partial [Tephrocybe rancida]
MYNPLIPIPDHGIIQRVKKGHLLHPNLNREDQELIATLTTSVQRHKIVEELAKSAVAATFVVHI